MSCQPYRQEDPEDAAPRVKRATQRRLRVRMVLMSFATPSHAGLSTQPGRRPLPVVRLLPGIAFLFLVGRSTKDLVGKPPTLPTVRVRPNQGLPRA